MVRDEDVGQARIYMRLSSSAFPTSRGTGREAVCLEGGALQGWKVVGGGGQSHCQEAGSNSSPVPPA